METLQEFGLELIRTLQSLSPTLDGMMNLFTFLGSTEFYLLLIPLLYWSVDCALGFRALLVLLCTNMVGLILKVLWHQPRPYWVGGVKTLGEESTYGIPSVHASVSLAVWGYVAHRLHKAWVWVIAGVMIGFISLSRLYLAVHFPHDVLLGWVIGGIFLWIFNAREDQVANWANRQGLWGQIGTGFILSLATILVSYLIHRTVAGIPDVEAWRVYAAQARSLDYAFTLGGTLFGAVSGYALMRRYAHFDAGGRWSKRLERYLAGAIGVVVIYSGVDVLFGLLAADETALGYTLRYIRYGAVAWWVTFAAPWAFLKVKLADPAGYRTND